MLIGGFQKSSLIDFPKKVSAIIFTKGCNFACPYCHNPELFDNTSEVLKISDVLSFLKKRKGLLDGVVITGGEPTLHNDLPELIKEIKKLEYLIKLDTNGSNPQMLDELFSQKMVDYIAMDIKAPLDKYAKITGKNIPINNIAKSIQLIMQNQNIEYEFRTTVVKSQLDFNDFEKISELISGAKKYYLQRFIPSKLLNNSFKEEKTYSEEEFEQIKKILTKNIQQVYIR